MSDLEDELAEMFRDEAARRLELMDAGLLAVESGNAGAEHDQLFRQAHTIKGAAGMVGLDDVRVVAHAAEDILAAARNGAFPPELRPAAPRGRAPRQVAGRAARDAVIAELAATMAPLPAAQPGRRGPARRRARPAGGVPVGRPGPARPARRRPGLGHRPGQPNGPARPPERPGHRRRHRGTRSGCRPRRSTGCSTWSARWC